MKMWASIRASWVEDRADSEVGFEIFEGFFDGDEPVPAAIFLIALARPGTYLYVSKCRGLPRFRGPQTFFAPLRIAPC